ncbi:hypothetical protein EON63_04005 [archaeon]|nr:MAG: hypothetical protein EON63_04005 [archaeon]
MTSILPVQLNLSSRERSKHTLTASQSIAKGSALSRISLPPIVTTVKETKTTFGSLFNSVRTRRQFAFATARQDNDVPCMKDEDETGSDCTSSMESLSSDEDSSPMSPSSHNTNQTIHVRTTKATTPSQAETEQRERARLHALKKIMQAMESSGDFAYELSARHTMSHTHTHTQSVHLRSPPRSTFYPTPSKSKQHVSEPSRDEGTSGNVCMAHVMPRHPVCRTSENAADMMDRSSSIHTLAMPRKFCRRNVMMGMLRKIPDTVLEDHEM